MSDGIKEAFERTADPRAQYASHQIWKEGLSITYQVQDCPHSSKLYHGFTDCHPITSEPGTRSVIEAAEAIGHAALREREA